MSEILKKAEQFSPTALFLLSALAGSGTFGGMRLLTDLHNQVSPPTPPDNSLKLQLPNPRKPHYETSIEGSDPMMGTQLPSLNKTSELEIPPTVASPPQVNTLGNVWMPYVAMAAGLPAGFLGTKAIYDSYKQNEQEAQIAEAKKQYTNQLMTAQHTTAKLGEETPCVDALCEAIADERKKSAGLKELYNTVKIPAIGGGVGLGAYQGVSHLPSSGNVMGGSPNVVPGLGDEKIRATAAHDPASVAGYKSQVNQWGRAGTADAANQLSGGTTGAAWDALKVVGALSGVGILGLLIHNHNKKKEREQKANYPTTVTYA